MAEIIKLLIVDDNSLDRQIYLDAIRDINRELKPHFEIEPIVKTNKVEGLDAIINLKDDLNGAFIDLKLTTGLPVDVSEGNELIDEIYQKLRFPIIVLTNTPGDFNRKFKTSLFLQVINKTDANYLKIIESIIRIYKTGITKILGRKGMIEKMLDEIFWKNISTTLVDWLDVSNSEKPLLRYTLTHLQEHLEISDDGSMFDNVHPIENYIKPTIKEYFFTGDIIHLKRQINSRFIILTPACDLAPHGPDKIPKSKEVLLAEIQPFSEGVIQQKTALANQARTKENEHEIDAAKNDLIKIFSNNYSAKYYYLPSTKIIEGGLINFQRLTTVKLKIVKNDYDKEATVTVQFIKDIISKFSYYYSRQGSPDFDFDALLESHLKLEV